MCYLYPVCNCEDRILIKLYSSLKILITYYPTLCIITFYCYFIRGGLYKNLAVKIIYPICCLAIILTFYLIFDGNSERKPDLEIFIFAFSISPIFHLMALKKLNWKIKVFIEKTLPGTLILIVMFLQYLLNTLFLNKIKDFFIFWGVREGHNIFMLILSVYSGLYLFLFKTALIKFSILVKMEKYPNANPIIFTSRICLCYTITIQISSLTNFHLDNWGGWICFFQYCIFLVQFFSRSNIYIALLIYIMKKLRISIKKPIPSKTEIEIEKIFTGAMVDFIVIFVSRILILFLGKRWINFHFLEFSKNCELEIADEKMFTINFVVFIISTTVMVEIITFFILAKLKKKEFIKKTIKGSILKQAYSIFLIHCIFELVFQDFLKVVQN